MAGLPACEPRKDPTILEKSALDQDYDNMSKAIENGIRTMTWAKDFDKTFTGSEHYISYYMGGGGPRTWTSIVGLDGRYILEMELPIDLDASGIQVTPKETPTFVLSEVRSITLLPDGRKHVKNDPKGIVRFGPPEWAKLIAAHGDLSAIGVVVKTGSPLDGFEKPWINL